MQWKGENLIRILKWEIEMEQARKNMPINSKVENWYYCLATRKLQVVCIHVKNGGLFRSAVKIHPQNGKVLRQNAALSARHQTMTRADFFVQQLCRGSQYKNIFIWHFFSILGRTKCANFFVKTYCLWHKQLENEIILGGHRAPFFRKWVRTLLFSTFLSMEWMGKRLLACL